MSRKKNISFSAALLAVPLCSMLFALSCNGIFMDEEPADNPRNNFNLLWQIIDERYCFFEEKRIDWDSIYRKYSPAIPQEINTNDNIDDRLFDILARMLLELKDGHVTLSNDAEVRAYNGWYIPYPDNFNESIILRYYNNRTQHLDNGMTFTLLSESVGYVRCPSFSDKINRHELDQALSAFRNCKGIIIDVRNNGGGLVPEAYALASRFARQKTHVGYVRYKTGKGHNDFSEYFPRYVKPEGANPFHGKLVILTNRRVYSAANLFVSIMKSLPQTHVIGDYTGGGGGIPVSAELYNGWAVELSANPVYDTGKRSIEEGIKPHREMILEIKLGYHRSTDSYIETAVNWIIDDF
jgi:hypothetical protein